VQRKLAVRWGTGDLRPVGVDDDFCRLLQESGCDYVNLSIESGSAVMLERIKRGYTIKQIREALESLVETNLPFGASLMFGAPGETPETIRESLALIDEYPIPYGTWVTIGICLWTHHQPFLEEARRSGQFNDDRELFEGVNYISPELPKAYMIELIKTLQVHPNYTVQVNKAYA
jgi:coproporphyrinogen III oxidase-like Fe-S oxidoreductase